MFFIDPMWGTLEEAMLGEPSFQDNRATKCVAVSEGYVAHDVWTTNLRGTQHTLIQGELMNCEDPAHSNAMQDQCFLSPLCREW